MTNLNEKLQTGSRSDTNHISGRAVWDICRRAACFLCAHIYGDEAFPNIRRIGHPRGPDMNHPRLDWLEDVLANWETWHEGYFESDDEDDGELLARLYRNIKQKKEDPASVCPPMLVYRGTKKQDLRDLALLFKFNFLLGESARAQIPENFKEEIGPFACYRKGKFIHVDLVLSPDKTIWQYLQEKALSTQDLIEQDFDREPLYHEQHWKKTGGVIIDVRFSIDAYTRGTGVFVQSVDQALGRDTLLFKAAIKYGRDVLGDFIDGSIDPRLHIAGHSIGGALASAAAVRNAALAKELGIYLDCTTFNALGVHKNTLKGVSPDITPIIAFAVKNEPVTWLQTRAGEMPFVAPALNLVLKRSELKRPPGAIGAEQILRCRRLTKILHPNGPDGRYHWTFPSDVFPVHRRKPKGIHMPEYPQFPLVAHTEQLLETSRDLSEFLYRFLWGDLPTRYAIFKWFPSFKVKTILKIFNPKLVKGLDIAKLFILSEGVNAFIEDFSKEVHDMRGKIRASIPRHYMADVIDSFEYQYIRESTGKFPPDNINK